MTCPTDVEKTKRIEELELTVSRLLSYTISCSQQPAVLSQGLPPLPLRGIAPSPTANQAYSPKPPLPPKGLPPSPLLAAPVTPQPPRCPPHQSFGVGPSVILDFTPQPPQHLPPTLQETPPPPRHRPPPLSPSPGAGPSASLHPVAPGRKCRAPMSSVGKLSSSSIDKSALSSVNSVVQANLDLLGQEEKITTMASVLAREAYFGEEVMAQCTAQGYGDNLDFQLRK